MLMIQITLELNRAICNAFCKAACALSVGARLLSIVLVHVGTSNQVRTLVVDT